jgi:predicted DCC family thiol-disulfide oxidoreductase YuxK
MAHEAVILFDGVCNLCNAWVQFVIRHDARGRFAFAPLQSERAAQLLSGRNPGPVDSVVLVASEHVYVESTAALRIARRLDGPWSMGGALLLIPRPLRDAVYRLIARNRFRWFGRRDACMIPTDAIRSRFL